MRPIDADAFNEKYGNYYAEEGPEEGFIGTVGQLIDNAPTIEFDMERAYKNIRLLEKCNERPKLKFIRIITRYFPDDLICYEEYKGKPYYSIEYQENGETIVGYGTYKPDVLSRYLRDYFIDER